VNKISFHAKLPPSLQLLRYEDIQKVRRCEEQILYRIMLEKHSSFYLIVPELVKNLSIFCGTEIFISGVHNSPPLFFIMKQINSFHVLPSCFFKIHFNITQSMPGSSK